MSAADLSLTISWFPTGKPQGPAIGHPEYICWADFCSIVSSYRREDDEKDGPCFVPARFKPEWDGKYVRRLGRNLLARTLIALDCEPNKKTGEIAPPLAQPVARLRGLRWAGCAYTSHNHRPDSPRYRLVIPVSAEIDFETPAVDVVADYLGLGGVFDTSKRVASSVFYLPSCPPGRLDQHETIVVDGDPIDAALIRKVAGELLAERQAEQGRIAAEACTQAEMRRQAKIAAGFDPDDSLIEKIRSHLDLEHILLSHGYDKKGDKYRHPNSTSGGFGANIKTFAGIERIYSHNANDPLHRDNLPAWCDGVTALDAFDVIAILHYGGDRTKALRDMAERYLGNRTRERKAVAHLIHRLRDAGASQARIETAAFAKGASLGLSRAAVIDVAHHVVTKITAREAA